jgi:hypothetical protein
MSEIVFNDKNKQPNDKMLAEKLGGRFKYWTEIKKHTREKYGDTTDEWKCYGKKYGWQLKTLLKKRNLFFLIPHESYFKIVFIFGDKAVSEIERSSISDQLISDVVNAKKYAEGRGLSIEVKNRKCLPDIKKLIKIKTDN